MLVRITTGVIFHNLKAQVYGRFESRFLSKLPNLDNTALFQTIENILLVEGVEGCLGQDFLKTQELMSWEPTAQTVRNTPALEEFTTWFPKQSSELSNTHFTRGRA